MGRTVTIALADCGLSPKAADIVFTAVGGSVSGSTVVDAYDVTVTTAEDGTESVELATGCQIAVVLPNGRRRVIVVPADSSPVSLASLLATTPAPVNETQGAIDEAIATHNADPSAHPGLGGGNGSSIYPATAPPESGWTLVQSGEDATAPFGNNGVNFKKPSSAGANYDLALYLRALDTSKTYEFGLQTGGADTEDYVCQGVVAADDAFSFIQVFYWNGTNWRVSYASSLTSGLSLILGTQWKRTNSPIYIRQSFSGGGASCHYSLATDGYNWDEVTVDSAFGGRGFTKIGLVAGTRYGATMGLDARVRLFHFEEA